MENYLIRTKFVSKRTGTKCYIDLPVTATDAAAARAAVIDYIMNDIDHPKSVTDIKMQTMVRVLPRKESL